MEHREFVPEFEDVTADVGLELLKEKVQEYKGAMRVNDTKWMESVLSSPCLSNARIIPE